MKTITTIVITAILTLGFVATSVGALAMYKSQDNDTFVRINNLLIDGDRVTNYKFTDKDTKVTCYGSYSKRTTSIGDIVDSIGISCIK